jgi:hypothetical protein
VSYPVVLPDSIAGRAHAESGYVDAIDPVQALLLHPEEEGSP